MSFNQGMGVGQAQSSAQIRTNLPTTNVATQGSAMRPAGEPAGTNVAGGPQGEPPVKRKKKRPAAPANPLLANRRPVQNKKPAPKPNLTANKEQTLVNRQVREPEQLKPIETLPIYTVPKSQLDGVRHHVMRLHPPAAKRTVNLYDDTEFTPPLRLHRRDARAPAGGAAATDVMDEEKDTIEDDKERERQEIIKEERKRIREENQAQIAPSLKKSRPQAFQKKTEQVFRKDDTPESRKKLQLRYEEALPWHLEDFDGKNTWVGAYEAALSHKYVMMIRDSNGFRMIPVEKWYRFQSKARGKTFTLEEADAAMASKARPPRWFVESQKKEDDEKEKQRALAEAKKVGGLFVNSASNGRGAAARSRQENDGDDIDYDFEEDFADDEEGVNGLFEGEDEDTKATTEKIKKEQLAANIFGMRDEKEVWNEEDEQKREEEATKKLEKEMRKKILKREKNLDYDVDSDGNPYSSSSESIDSEEERRRDEEVKKEEAQKAKLEAKEADKSKQTASGASTKGNNTPSGRGKTVDSLKKPSKRPGSPNLSEASGNESSRKKHKKQHASGQPLNKLTNRVRGGAGSGSESEGGHKHKLKVHNKASPAASPGASRAGSPSAPGVSPSGSPLMAATTLPGNRGSPTASGTSTPVPAGSANQGMPTAEELLAVIPDEGLHLTILLNKFRHRFRTDKAGFIALVKSTLRLERDSKMLFRKEK